MRTKTEIKTTRASAVGSMIGGVLFMILGFVFSGMISQSGDPFGESVAGPAMIFLAFGLIGGGASFLYGLIGYKNNGIAEHQIVTEHQEPESSSRTPAQKLQELKSLLDSGIVTAEEYEAKKKEILNEKW